MAAEVVIDIVGRDNYSGVLGNFGSIITGIESAIHLAGEAFRTFSDLALQGLDAVASYERLSLALTTLNAAQLVQAGSAQDMASAMEISSVRASELLGWMQDLAIHSPFTLDGVAQAFRLAMAYGFTADEAQRLTQAFVDFSSGTGATEYNMQLIARALGQISTLGHLAGQDMLQLTSAGLPVAQILADAFGVTTEQIISMREDGLLPAQEVIEAITTWMETNFAGAADTFASSWAGLRGTFEDLKQMGLRELFTGMLDALQPLVVEFSNWLQGAGLEKIGEWGAALGEFTQRIVDQIPAAVAMIEQLKSAFEAGGITAVIHVVIGDLTAQDVVDWLDALDVQLAEAIGAHDFRASGDAFGNTLVGLFTTSVQSQGSEAIPALGTAISEFLLGAMGYVDWDQAFQVSDQAMTDLLLRLGRSIADVLADAFIAVVDWFLHPLTPEQEHEIAISAGQYGRDLVQGFVNGMNSFEVDATQWLREHIVDPIKRFLRIASPSGLFFDIGRDLIQGLIDGVVSMLGSLTSVITGIISALLAPLAPILDLLGIDLGGTTGTTGGRIPDTGDTRTGTGGVLSAATVTNNYNFYAPVYMSGVGPEGTYDCATSPVISSTTGGTTGGRTPVRT